MASIDRRPNGQWRARWREYPGGPQRAQHFARKVDAEQHLVKIQHDLLSGTYVTPRAAKTTVEAYAAAWLERMRPTWRTATAELVAVSIDKHVLPVLGKRPLVSVRRADVEALCAGLALKASTVRTVHQHLGQMFGGAVDDGLIPRNPASKARLPKVEPSSAQPVPPEVVGRITEALPDWLRVAVPLGVGVGLRQSEASGLTVDRVDFLRRTLRVDRQLHRGQGLVLVPPKTASSARTVPLAGIVVDALAAHLAAHPAGADGLILAGPDGDPVDANRFGHQWRRAVKTAGVPGLRYHDLRHTFASTLLSRGVSVKAVADWLGHASPTITLSTYAHLMPADEEVARAVLDAALAPEASHEARLTCS